LIELTAPILYFALKAWSLDTALTISWASSNMPRTAMLWMLASWQRIHLGALESAHPLVRREHEHPHTLLAAHRVFGRRAGIARGGAENVDLFALSARTYSKRWPSNCMAMSLKASVGPFDSSRIASPPSPRAGSGRSSQRKGVISLASALNPSVAVHLRVYRSGPAGLEIGRRDVIDEAAEHGVGQVGVRQPRHCSSSLR
jgi:hypothetical protein